MQPPAKVPAGLDGPDAGVSDPRELLLGYLDWYRDALMRKLAGLSDAQLRTPVDPLGWSPLGLVRRPRWHGSCSTCCRSTPATSATSTSRAS